MGVPEVFESNPWQANQYIHQKVKLQKYFVIVCIMLLPDCKNTPISWLNYNQNNQVSFMNCFYLYRFAQYFYNIVLENIALIEIHGVL